MSGRSVGRASTLAWAWAAAAAALASCVWVHGHGGCDADLSFDYFLLAVQWPPEFGVSDVGDWTLHGLWPSRTGSGPGGAASYPCACSDEALDMEQLRSVRADMDAFWRTLFKKNSNERFWAHEWSKHGTCAGMGSQLAYFSNTLAARARYDPAKAFAAHGVAPSDAKPLNASALAAAFQAELGEAPMLGCHFARTGGSSGPGGQPQRRQLLSEIGICLDKHTLDVVACDPSVERIHDEVNDCNIFDDVWFLKTAQELEHEHENEHEHELAVSM